MGRIDGDCFRRNGYSPPSDEMWMSSRVLDKSVRKHKDLGNLVKNETAVRRSITKLLKSPEFHCPNKHHDGMTVCGPVGNRYCLASLVFHDEGIHVATFHGYNRDRALDYLKRKLFMKWIDQKHLEDV